MTASLGLVAGAAAMAAALCGAKPADLACAVQEAMAWARGQLERGKVVDEAGVKTWGVASAATLRRKARALRKRGERDREEASTRATPTTGS